MKVLVVGADQGLGQVLSKMLSSRGHQVAAGFYDKNDRICAHEHNILALQTNVLEEEQLQEAAAVIAEKMGDLDAIIDVAGVLLGSDRRQNLMEQPLEDVLRHIQVNAIGLLSAFRHFYPVMKKGGTFLAVTSEGGSFAAGGSLFPSYGISKTTANKIVQTLRYTVNDVTLLAVHPGRMNTEMGRTTCEIEPEESAAGFCKLLEEGMPVDTQKTWFIDYQGKEMPL